MNDIPGTAPKTRKEVSSSKAMEITGTRANSYKRGISTKRITNPLQPQYNYLGNS